MMKNCIKFASIMICCVGVSGLAAGDEMQAYAGVREWAQDSDQRMEWWREARFGLFIHWGLYAAAGGYWPPDPAEGKLYPQHYSEWIQNWAKVPPAEYARLARPLFTAAKYDPSEWARLAKRAGMRYAVLTTKHHDGYTLFNSEAPYSLDNAISGGSNISPPGRDLVGEYVQAFRKAGLKVGFYYSLWDWQHLDAPEHGPNTGGQREYGNYVDYLHQHVRELMTNYGKIDIFWPDYSSDRFQGSFWRSRELLAKLREWQPEIIMNNRLWAGIENPNADFQTPEKYVPDTGLPGIDWEVCHTMNESFGFSFHDQKWKTVPETVRLLIDIASKGGNLLLNVGPAADGSLPEEAVGILEGVGDWMMIYGNAIHGTDAGPFPRLDWGRATRAGDRLYLFVYDWPSNGQLAVPLANDPESARIMGGQELKWKAGEKGLLLSGLPERAPNSIASVIELELDGEPEVIERLIDPD